MTLYRAAVIDTPGDPFAGEPADALAADQDGGVLVRDGIIVARGPFGSLHAEYPDEPVTELTGGLLLPGFVDTHVHYPQIRAIGGLGMPLLDWLEKCALPEESRLADPAYARCGGHGVPGRAAGLRDDDRAGVRLAFRARRGRAVHRGGSARTERHRRSGAQRPDPARGPAVHPGARAGREPRPDRALARQGQAAVRGHPPVLAVRLRGDPRRLHGTRAGRARRPGRHLVHLAPEREPRRGRRGGRRCSPGRITTWAPTTSTGWSTTAASSRTTCTPATRNWR